MVVEVGVARVVERVALLPFPEESAIVVTPAAQSSKAKCAYRPESSCALAVPQRIRKKNDPQTAMNEIGVLR